MCRPGLETKDYYFANALTRNACTRKKLRSLKRRDAKNSLKWGGKFEREKKLGKLIF